MIERFLKKDIHNDLQEFPCIAVLGPRQIGKTTLAQEYAKDCNAYYCDLEHPQTLTSLSNDPDTFFKQHLNRLVIIDEIQNYPHLFKILRGIIDQNIRSGKKSNQFILLGSAAQYNLKQISQTLAGRISYLYLKGFSPREIIDSCDDVSSHLMRLWYRGGFPNSYLAHSNHQCYRWRNNYINSFIQQEISNLDPNIASGIYFRLWMNIADRQGQIIDPSSLAAPLKISAKTVSHFINFLESSLLLRKLHPWVRNIGRGLIKSPRIYIRDSGILHAMLRIPDTESLLSHPIAGRSWEGFVIEAIINSLPMLLEASFYRSVKLGSEIDLLLHLGNRPHIAIEIKSTRQSSPRIKKGFYKACEELGVEHKYLIYSGDTSYTTSEQVKVMSLLAFLDELPRISPQFKD